MADRPSEPDVSAIRDAARPAVADRAAFEAELDRIRVREKAHTREGDAIAAARRRLPMVEVDPRIPLIGADGSVPLIDVFDGRSQLVAYYHMWHTGRPAAEQCEGCNFNVSHVTELGYLHSRDVTYAVFCEGPYRGGLAVPRLHRAVVPLREPGRSKKFHFRHMRALDAKRCLTPGSRSRRNAHARYTYV